MADEKGYPTGEDIREAFEPGKDTRTEEEKKQDLKDYYKKQKSPPGMERTALTMSVLILILGVFSLFNVEKGSDSWYVLMIVFAGNTVLLVWIFIRLIKRFRARKREENKNSKT